MENIQNSLIINSIFYFLIILESFNDALKLFIENNNSESLDICSKIYLLSPDNINNLFLLVANNIVIKNADKAIYYSQKIIQLQPNSSGLFYYI